MRIRYRVPEFTDLFEIARRLCGCKFRIVLGGWSMFAFLNEKASLR